MGCQATFKRLWGRNRIRLSWRDVFRKQWDREGGEKDMHSRDLSAKETWLLLNYATSHLRAISRAQVLTYSGTTFILN